MPQPVIDAILAVEDADFYHHNGVNVRAIIRALIENVDAGGVEQGGSTITQQLVKNALLTSERDFDRKAKEVALAIRLEQQLTKDQILEKYLNTVYFGSGAYGVQAAAETYWGVDVGAARLRRRRPCSPRSSPTRWPTTRRCTRRWPTSSGALALERMVSLGQDHPRRGRPVPDRAAAGAPLRPDAIRASRCRAATRRCPQADDYFCEEVKQQLLDDPDLGATTRTERVARLFGGGLKIYTTLDPVGASRGRTGRAPTSTPQNDKGITAAMVSVDNRTGAVRALVGGPGFDTYQYDIATLEPGRQTGSSFKTFMLLTALEQGNLPFDTIQGGGSFPSPGCEPNPYKVDGPGGTLTYVTTKSSNGAFVRLGQIVGLENVIDIAGRLGVTNPDFDPKSSRCRSAPRT